MVESEDVIKTREEDNFKICINIISFRASVRKVDCIKIVEKHVCILIATGHIISSDIVDCSSY